MNNLQFWDLNQNPLKLLKRFKWSVVKAIAVNMVVSVTDPGYLILPTNLAYSSYCLVSFLMAGVCIITAEGNHNDKSWNFLESLELSFVIQ